MPLVHRDNRVWWTILVGVTVGWLFLLFPMVVFAEEAEEVAGVQCNCGFVIEGALEILPDLEYCGYDYEIVGLDGEQCAGDDGFGSIILEAGSTISTFASLAPTDCVPDDQDLLTGFLEADELISLPFTPPTDCAGLNLQNYYLPSDDVGKGYLVTFRNGVFLSETQDPRTCQVAEDFILQADAGDVEYLDQRYTSFKNDNSHLFTGNELNGCPAFPADFRERLTVGPIESLPGFTFEEAPACPGAMSGFTEISGPFSEFYVVAFACDGAMTIGANPPSPTEDPEVVDAYVNPFTFPYAETESLNQFPGANLQTLIGRVITFPLGVIGAFALLMFIYAGLLWMTSSGSSEKTHKAISIMVWTSAGLVTALSVYAIVQFLFQAFG